MRREIDILEIGGYIIGLDLLFIIDRNMLILIVRSKIFGINYSF